VNNPMIGPERKETDRGNNRETKAPTLTGGTTSRSWGERSQSRQGEGGIGVHSDSAKKTAARRAMKWDQKDAKRELEEMGEKGLEGGNSNAGRGWQKDRGRQRSFREKSKIKRLPGKKVEG